MRTQSRDTSPEAERVLIDLIRKVPVSKRFDIVRSVTSTMAQTNIRDIQRLHPTASLLEIACIFVSGTDDQARWRLAKSLKGNALDIAYLQHWAENLRVSDLLARAFAEAGFKTE